MQCLLLFKVQLKTWVSTSWIGIRTRLFRSITELFFFYLEQTIRKIFSRCQRLVFWSHKNDVGASICWACWKHVNQRINLGHEFHGREERESREQVDSKDIEREYHTSRIVGECWISNRPKTDSRTYKKRRVVYVLQKWSTRGIMIVCSEHVHLDIMRTNPCDELHCNGERERKMCVCRIVNMVREIL